MIPRVRKFLESPERHAQAVVGVVITGVRLGQFSKGICGLGIVVGIEQGPRKGLQDGGGCGLFLTHSEEQLGRGVRISLPQQRHGAVVPVIGGSGGASGVTVNL